MSFLQAKQALPVLAASAPEASSSLIFAFPPFFFAAPAPAGISSSLTSATEMSVSSLRERLRALVSLALGALPVALLPPPPFFVLVAAAMEVDAGDQVWMLLLLAVAIYHAGALVAVVWRKESSDVMERRRDSTPGRELRSAKLEIRASGPGDGAVG